MREEKAAMKLVGKKHPYKCYITGSSIDDVKRCAEHCGSHWFEPGTMRFFNSRLFDRIYRDGRGGAYFVTSEKGPNGIRGYSVRHYSPEKCQINTIGKFQKYSSGAAAKAVAEKIAAKSRKRKRGYKMIKDYGGGRYRRLRGV